MSDADAETGRIPGGEAIQGQVQDAEQKLRDAAEAVRKIGGPKMKKVWQSLNAAANATRRAAKHLGVALGLTAAVAMSQGVEGASLGDADAGSPVSMTELSGADGPNGDPWSISVKEDRLEGVTLVTAVTSAIPEPGGAQAQLGVSCEIGQDAPAITLAFEDGGRSNVHGDMRMKFDGGRAFSQWVEGATLSGNVPLSVGSIGADVGQSGHGKTEFFRAMTESQSLLVAAPDGKFAEFNLDSDTFRAASQQIGDICALRTQQYATGIHRAVAEWDSQRDMQRDMVAPQPTVQHAVIDRRVSQPVESGPFVSHDVLADGVERCNRGMMSREGARWTGSAIGAVAGLAATQGKHDRVKVGAALLGAVLGNRVASTVDRRLQQNRDVGQAGEARHYQIRKDGEVQIHSFITMADGNGCVVRSDSYGNEVGRAHRIKADHFHSLESQLERAGARVDVEPQRDFRTVGRLGTQRLQRTGLGR